MTYDWDFGNGKGSKSPNAVAKYKKPGYYEAELTVADAQGKTSSSKVSIRVGNEMPKLDLTVKGNQTFFFPGKPLDYAIKVSDKEDGEVGKGISSEDVAVSLNYIEGFDRTGVAQGHQTNSGFVAGKRLIELSDCKSCHQMNDKSVGPSWMDVSNKYKTSWEPVAGILANKILKGGKGVWGEQAMNAHPQLTKSEAESMAEYILSLAKDKKPENRPLAAAVNLTEHEKKQPGMYILSASYTDKGIPMVGALIASQTIALRSPGVVCYRSGCQPGDDACTGQQPHASSQRQRLPALQWHRPDGCFRNHGVHQRLWRRWENRIAHGFAGRGTAG